MYVYLKVLFPSTPDYLAGVISLGYGPNFMDLLTNADAFLNGFVTNPDGSDVSITPYDGSFIFEPVANDTWYTVEMHAYQTLSPNHFNYEIWVNGTSVYTSFDSGIFAARKGRVGLNGSLPDASQIYFLDDVRFGTTRGGTELFSDDFEGDLTGWTAITGSASIVDEADIDSSPPADDADTIPLLLVPSSTEQIDNDGGTLIFRERPSSVDVAAYVEAATARATLTPSGADHVCIEISQFKATGPFLRWGSSDAAPRWKGAQQNLRWTGQLIEGVINNPC
jgi:hypothetical protein